MPETVNTGGVQYDGGDATADFNQVLNDSRRWVIKRNVPVFKAHQRKDPATGNMIVVDEQKLHRIAANMQRLERDGGVPIRMTLGHTEPGKPEHQQPPVGGYYRNARVGKFGPRAEPAVMVDEWLDPHYADKRKNYPYRSAEYYDDAEQITGVALLTRDPYLDLGVVAYSRGEPHGKGFTRRDVPFLSYTAPAPIPVPYHRADGRRPVMYRFTIGDLPMFPQNGQPQPAPQQFQAVPPAAPQYPQPAPQYNAPPAQQYSNVPVSYAQPAAPVPYGWGGPNRYATEPPSVGGMGGGGADSGMGALVAALQQAVQIAQGMIEGGSVAPQEPFPGGGGMDGNPMTPNARYGQNQRYAQGHQSRGGDVDRRNFRQGVRGMNRQQGEDMREDGNQHRLATPRNPDGERGYARYERGQQPTVAPGAGTTISGLPVGYQMKLDQLQYQNAQLLQGMQVLMYERDQADTQECVAEIRRLASMGFPVDETEIAELKKQPREQRPQYLERIAAKYQRVGTENLPPILGDPTPSAPDNQASRPVSREEMEAALNLVGNSKDPTAYTKALQHIRGGGQPTQYGANRLQPGQQHAWPQGGDAPLGANFGDPYAGMEPNGNGQY